MSLKRFIIILILVLCCYVLLSFFNLNSSQTDYVKTFFNFIQFKEKKILVVPKFNVDESIEHAYHWKSDAGYFVLIADDLETFYGPDLLSDTYKVLNQSQRVQILYENKQPTLIDNEFQTWVFLGNETGDRYLGWAFKDQLLSNRDFTPLKDMQLSNFSFSRGQMDAVVMFYDLGRFGYKWKAEGNGLYLEGEDSGQVTMSGDIVWLKKDNEDYLYDFFILDDTNYLNQEYRFRNDVITLNMFVLP